ncbi:probable protein phosphatase 2C 62 isoform X2 [Daucus carota subsp. sativus]|uniref:probable protein phosphatase 2C 62 isoform X2 n=1 Tax=Daucus carota subsp. sativus TaxID=79200 RepID=UPI003082AA11
MTSTQMGDKLCTSLDSPSFITSSLPHYKLYNPIFKLQLLNPKPTCNTSSKSRTTRRKNGLLNLTVLCAPISSAPSSPDFDIVSTSEGSDGSFVFRFGDASEMERIRELEELRKLEELRELGGGSNEISYDLKVLDGNDEEEVVVKTIEREGLDVSEEHSDFIPTSSENLIQESDERSSQADILNASEETSTSALDSENACMTENSTQKNCHENSTSTCSLSNNSLTIEGNIPEPNIGDESVSDSVNVGITVTEVAQSDEGDIRKNIRTEDAGIDNSVRAVGILEHDVDSGNAHEGNNYNDSLSDSGNLPESFTEVPQSNDACKDDSQESLSSEAAGFEESPQAETIETPVMLNESSSISTLEPEITDVEVLIGDMARVSDSDAVEVSSGDLTDAGADMQLIRNHIIRTTDMEDHIKILETKIEDQNGRFDEQNRKFEEMMRMMRDIEDLSRNLKDVNSHLAELSRDLDTGGIDSSRSSLGEEISTPELCLSSGAALLPHPSKALAGGEESYFVTNLNWLGVADGVGQWSLEGSNPGVYARELMEHCGKIVSNSSGISILKPVEVLHRIVAEAQSPGSSTILLAHFDGQILHVANIGDSGFIVIRNGTVHRCSSPMHHEFHFPLQIAKGHDPSELVEEYQIDLELGDIVVTATDGLLDNLYMEEIASTVAKSLDAKINAQEIAKLLARRAQEVGKSAFGNSPFADSARAAGYKGYTGGKLDDVAVIVSLVQKRLISNA